MPTFLDKHISLGKVKLKVSRLARSIQFYEEVVGLKVLQHDADNGVVSFTADGQHTLLVLEEVSGICVSK